MPLPIRPLLAAAAATIVVVGGGLVIAGSSSPDSPDSLDAPAAPASSATATATAPVVTVPLDQIDTRMVAVQRRSFCSLVPDSAVVQALGAAPESEELYDNGESASLTKQVSDIAHEYGCTWADAGRAARAWVFAPPVSLGRARALLKDASEEKGCSPIADAPAFGRPSAGLVCSTRQGVQASYRGLFGDAWLTCSVSGTDPRAAVEERAEDFCVAILTAASTQ